MPNENGKEFLQKFITDNEGSWRERQLARKEERMRVRREAAEKAKATLEGRNTTNPPRKKDGKSNPEYDDYRRKQLEDEGLLGETAPNSVWANLERGVQIRPDQMGKSHPLVDHPDIPPGEDDERIYE
jgi:hypothetical protein